MKNAKQPVFKFAFLHPKYWGLWIGFTLFRLILLLPYPLLVKIGLSLGHLFRHLKVGKRRIAVARRNLQLCFPHLSSDEIEKVLQKNVESVGMAIIETGMAWFWSDERIRKWSKAEGLENLPKEEEKCGAIFVGVHFLTLELGARIASLYTSGVAVYRPNDNPVFDWFQFRGRKRSAKALIDRKNVRGMIEALQQKEFVWYAPDHDYGKRKSVFVPFFAVEKAATTTGSHILLTCSDNIKVIPFSPLRNADYSGYTLTFSPTVDFSLCDDEEKTARLMNQIIEQEILRDITQYMWLHRRFKTRPEGEASLY